MQSTLSPLNEPVLAGVLFPLLPTVLREPRSANDNAIEYRNIMLLGAQGSGKTTTVQSIALSLATKYGSTRTVFAIQVAGIDRLLTMPTRIRAVCWVLCAEDVTLAKIPAEQISQFFRVRHLIAQNTGLQKGIVATIFATHTFHGLEKNLRDTFDALIIKSVPTNPYDRSILKRYFDPWLLDEYSRAWSIDQALMWTRDHPHGIFVYVVPPAEGAIKNVNVRRSFWSRLFGGK